MKPLTGQSTLADLEKFLRALGVRLEATPIGQTWIVEAIGTTRVGVAAAVVTVTATESSPDLAEAIMSTLGTWTLNEAAVRQGVKQ